MDLSPVLGVLGVDSLADITLEKLRDKVNNVHHGVLSRQQVLQAFMGWLHERITRDIQQKSLLSEFMDLLLVPGKLHQHLFNEGEVCAAFNEWQVKDAAENPANIRRYQMVQSDFRDLFEEADRDSNSGPEWSFGPSGLDRERDSSADPDEPTSTRIVGGGKRKSGSNGIPLGSKKRSRNHTHQKITNSVKSTKPANPKFAKPSKSPKSIKSISLGEAEEEFNVGNYTLVELENASLGISNHEKPYLLDVSMTMYGQPNPPPQYVCKRCHQSGHWIQLCPTNLNPDWDSPPPPDYTCDICQKKGHHFATLCPQNQKFSSLTKQRQRREEHAHEELITPTRSGGVRGRDPRRLTPPSRQRSRSPRNTPRRPEPGIIGLDGGKSQVLGSGNANRTKYRDRSVSPWTVRRRMTFKDDDHYDKGSNKHRHNHPQNLTGKLPYRQAKAPQNFRSFLNLDETRKEDIGRLSYDDVFVGPRPSSKEPILTHRPKPAEAYEGEKKVIKSEPMDTQQICNEMEGAGTEADRFLDELEDEILTGTPGRKSGLDILSFLESRGNPIINRKPNRKTAADMFDEVQKYRTDH
ncbi:hypothetical protein F5B19DRAFT_190020 [Rostrohypoxylon terebratum]|nr:hypothetical protein F5B19DRAFT_190020 [Rostrohypoxylon terebratum]